HRTSRFGFTGVANFAVRCLLLAELLRHLAAEQRRKGTALGFALVEHGRRVLVTRTTDLDLNNLPLFPYTWCSVGPSSDLVISRSPRDGDALFVWVWRCTAKPCLTQQCLRKRVVDPIAYDTDFRC